MRPFSSKNYNFIRYETIKGASCKNHLPSQTSLDGVDEISSKKNINIFRKLIIMWENFLRCRMTILVENTDLYPCLHIIVFSNPTRES